jgi:hypothetical protein
MLPVFRVKVSRFSEKEPDNVDNAEYYTKSIQEKKS